MKQIPRTIGHLVLGVLLPLLLPLEAIGSPAMVHGIHLDIRTEGAVCIARAYYEGGTAVTDGDITVLAPGSEEAWQTGRTDPAGRFAFLPDSEGTWTVTVDDAHGHRTRNTVVIGPDQVRSAPAGGEAGSPAHSHEHGGEAGTEHAHEPAHEDGGGDEDRLWQLLAGLGIIAGIAGTAYGITARRQGKRAA